LCHDGGGGFCPSSSRLLINILVKLSRSAI
jgi:hypothetical protein